MQDPDLTEHTLTCMHDIGIYWSQVLFVKHCMSADLFDKPINQLTSSVKPVEYLFLLFSLHQVMCIKSAAADPSSC